MKAKDIKAVLTEAFKITGKPIPRIEQTRTSSLELPVVIVRQSGGARFEVLDVGGLNFPMYEIICRAASPKGAQTMGDCILNGLCRLGKLNRIEDDFDGEDTGSAQRLKYFERFIYVELM